MPELRRRVGKIDAMTHLLKICTSSPVQMRCLRIDDRLLLPGLPSARPRNQKWWPISWIRTCRTKWPRSSPLSTQWSSSGPAVEKYDAHVLGLVRDTFFVERQALVQPQQVELALKLHFVACRLVGKVDNTNRDTVYMLAQSLGYLFEGISGERFEILQRWWGCIAHRDGR